MSKVLFVYPNKEGYPGLHLGIAALSGILKRHGHKTDLFDITFMSQHLDHEAREKTGVVEKVDVEKYWGAGDRIDIEEGFRKKILSFQPDLIAFSVVENNFGCAQKFFKIAKETTKAPIVVGGTFPTVAPEFFLKENNVDIICRGEGEYSLLELVKRVQEGKNFLGIPNLIVKDKGKAVESNFANYYNWEEAVFTELQLRP